MGWKETADEYCSIARTLAVIGERWTLLVIREAFSGVRRFEDFQHHLDIARNVLTDRLQRLVRAGLLEKKAYQDKPKRFEYRLTDSGRGLYPVLVSLMAWGDRWRAGPEGPPLLLVHDACSKAGHPRFTCSECGSEMHARNCHLVSGPGLPRRVAKERDREIERLREAYRRPTPAAGKSGAGKSAVRE